ncbi:MAG: hypothetical protein HY940_02320 [Gammaproteobacteria bacterium]|nr:hypothetical protein [Gammaproteobacteria bacterium]
MTLFEEQFEAFKYWRAKSSVEEPSFTPLSNGSYLITVPGIEMPPGWDRKDATILFVAPPGYPAAQPDCFWVQPGRLRLENSATPQASNDSNPIPGDTVNQRNTTWFSWHLQSWNPNNDSLITYFKVIMQRLNPAR